MKLDPKIEAIIKIAQYHKNTNCNCDACNYIKKVIQLNYKQN